MITGKTKQLTITECNNLIITFDTVIGQVDVSGCHKLSLQINEEHSCGIIQLFNCQDVKVFTLDKKSREKLSTVTSNCKDILVQCCEEEENYVDTEFFIPTQIKCTFPEPDAKAIVAEVIVHGEKK